MIFNHFRSWLSGEPDTVIKILLILLSLFGLLVAFFGTPVSRLIVTAYFLFP